MIKKTFYYYPLNEVIRTLDIVRDTLRSNEFEALNIFSGLDVSDIEKRIVKAERLLEKHLSKKFLLINAESEYPLDALYRSWVDFQHDFSGDLTDDTITRYKELLKSTKLFLNSISYLSEDSSVDKNESVRNKDRKEEEERLGQLRKRRSELWSQYVAAQHETPPNEKKIKQLKEKIDSLDEELGERKETIENIQKDADEEKRITERINKAFEELKNVDDLSSELKKLKVEFYVCLVALGIVVAAFLGFYCWFLSNVSTFRFEKWHEYMPYTMSVPITIGLLWLFVYLKNRASKISLEISSQLYEIHYIESLLKLTNKVSRSSEQAMDNIERMVNTMVSSFMEKIKSRGLEEKSVANIEKQELEGSPCWKVMQELKELIKIVHK